MLGVNVNKLTAIGFSIGCGLAGVSGTLLSTIYIFNPFSDMSFLFKAICIVILAGAGRAGILGTFMGSFILAIIENLGVVLLPPAYVPLLDYVVLLVLLLFFPQGIGGKRA
jgi:branched-chain amino acid transport system permease protein